MTKHDKKGVEARMQILQITLRAARVNCGLTLKDVAHETGRSVDTISKYEIDSTNIPRDLMVELIDLYQIPDEHIFFGKESSFHGFRKYRPQQPA